MGLDVEQDSLLVVEGAVGSSDGIALGERDADTSLLLDNGCSRSHEGKSHCDQSGLGEHGSVALAGKARKTLK